MAQFGGMPNNGIGNVMAGLPQQQNNSHVIQQNIMHLLQQQPPLQGWRVQVGNRDRMMKVFQMWVLNLSSLVHLSSQSGRGSCYHGMRNGMRNNFIPTLLHLLICSVVSLHSS